MRRFIKIFIKVLLVLFILGTIPNYSSYIYKFEEGQSFHGDSFYNPYKNLDGSWIKCNLHAHSKTFAGIANGKNTAGELIEKYDSLEYGLACISNYNLIQDSIPGHNYLPVYEHGFNIKWIHQLVVNAHGVKWFDFPLIQLLSNKQFILNRLKNESGLVILNHPSYKSAYTKTNLKYLNSYDMIEGISPFSNSIKQWDIALSYGHAVWIVGNDDAHDLSDYHTAICWNMINTDTINRETIVQSLKHGKSYATKGWIGQEMNRLKKVKVENNVYKLTLRNTADTIILYSDFGKQVSFAVNSDSIVYKIKPENSYVRAEVFETESWNTYTRMYFNPVIRTVGNKLAQHANKCKISYVLSIFYWLLLLLTHAVCIRILWKW